MSCAFSETIELRFESAKWKVCVLWIDNFLNFIYDEFPSLYFQSKSRFAGITFLQKRMWKCLCYKCMIWSGLFAANIAVEQEVIVAAITIDLLYLHASGLSECEGCGKREPYFKFSRFGVIFSVYTLSKIYELFYDYIFI